MAEADRLILVAVGPDHVGLVQKISESIVEHGGNIEDSRMAVLAGEFALIILISGSRSNLSAIAKSAAELGEQIGLNIWTRHPAGKKSAAASLPYRLVASCMDHPGVVHKLSTTLSKHEINIESMETQKYAAPVTGAPIFRMEAVITVPAAINVNALREAFEQMERDENVNIELELIR